MDTMTYNPKVFFSKPHFEYKSIEPNALSDEYVNNTLLLLHEPYPVLKYIEVKMEKYSLPEAKELCIGGSWNIFTNLPQFNARVNLFEHNFFPYNLLTKNFTTINNVFFWKTPLNLSVYTLLSDPMCVFIYKKNTDINHDNNIINDYNNSNYSNSNYNVDDTGTISIAGNSSGNSSTEVGYNNNEKDNNMDLFFTQGNNKTSDTKATFTCLGFFKFASDAIYLTEYN